MKNITISLSDELAHRAKVFAAEQNTSVSRYVGALLSEKLESEAGYRAAMRRWFASAPTVLNASGGPYPGRDSLYER
jgi:predicted transcriptional regulator